MNLAGVSPAYTTHKVVIANKIDHVRTPATVAAAPGHGQKPVRHLTMDHVTERWLPVVGYEGYYEISSLGRLRSVPRVIRRKDGFLAHYTQYRVMKPAVNKNGYPATFLSRDGDKQVKIHQLVCEAFHGPRPVDHCVRHLNGNPADNRAENLRWGTRSENMQDKRTHGTNYWLNRTECVNGHEWTPENTVYYPYRPTKRHCRECIKAKSARNLEARRRRARAS